MSDAEQFLRSYFDACIACDVDRAMEFMSEDVVYIDYALGFHATDKAYLRKCWNKYFEISMNADHASTVHSVNVFPDGGYTVEWTEYNRFNRDFQFLPATGEPYAVRGVSVGVIRDGLIVHNIDYYDLTTILVQSGIAEIPTTIPVVEFARNA